MQIFFAKQIWQRIQSQSFIICNFIFQYGYIRTGNRNNKLGIPYIQKSIAQR